MNGQRSAVKKGGQCLLHRRFYPPYHSVDDMRVQILEKVYYSSEKDKRTVLDQGARYSQTIQLKRPYQMVGTLSSIPCKKTNI